MVLTAGTRITTLDLCLYSLASKYSYSRDHPYNIKGKDVEMLAGVLAQCPSLIHLNLGGNQIGDAGTDSLAGILTQYRVFTHINHGMNGIRPNGGDRLVGVLWQCATLAHLDVMMKREYANICQEKEEKEGRKKEDSCTEGFFSPSVSHVHTSVYHKPCQSVKHKCIQVLSQ